MVRYGSVCSGIEAAQTVPRGPYRNLCGHRNGRLVAVSVAGRRQGGHLLWLCKCDCGGEKIVSSNNLTRPSGTKSCGCLRIAAAAARIKKHGVWNDGKSYAVEDGRRCYKTRHAWAKAAIRHYGNRCERCGWDAARCDVHHRHHKAEGGLHTIENAVVLCPNCHRIEHGTNR